MSNEIVDKILCRALVLDFETYFLQQRAGGPSNYSLKGLTVPEYVEDPRFKIHGCAWATPNNSGMVRIPSKEWDDLRNCLGQNFERRVVCYHNAFFDDYIMLNRLGIKPPKIIDTKQLAHAILGAKSEGGESADLGSLSKLLGLPDKGRIGNFNGMRVVLGKDWENLSRYATRDALNQLAILEKLLPALDNPVTELRAAQHTIRMYTDKNRWLGFDAGCAETLKADINREFATFFRLANLDPERVGKATFFKDFQAELQKCGRTLPMKQGKNGMIPAVAKKDADMQAFLNDADLPQAVRDLAHARIKKDEWDQLDTKLTTMLKYGKTGTIPCMMHYCGAHTGRWTGGGGMNLFNLNREGMGARIRGTLTARAGHTFLIRDYAQIEARLTAYYAGEEGLVEAFRRGDDVYSQFASLAFNEEVRKPKPGDAPDKAKRMEGLRHVGKSSILGMGFGAGVKKIDLMFRAQPALAALFESGILSTDKVSFLHKEYRHLYPAIPQFWQDAEDFLYDTLRFGEATLGDFRAKIHKGGLHVWLPSGRRLRYPRVKVSEKRVYPFREMVYGNFFKTLYSSKIVENLMQAVARDILVDAIVALEAAGIRVAYHCYDEVVLEVPKDQVQEKMAQMEKIMAPRDWYAAIPITGETKVSERYLK